MPFELTLRFHCDTCAVIVEQRKVTPCPPMPASITMNGVQLPAGWDRDEQGKLGCHLHKQLVVPAMADVQGILDAAVNGKVRH